jgi:uncharacterized oxidoreductase
MQIEANTVLITGGGSGIGLAMAKRFLTAGSQVIVCGRDEAKLRRAQVENPGLVTYTCNVANLAEREELVRWATSEHPTLNVIVNSAGIQRRIRLAAMVRNTRSITTSWSASAFEKSSRLPSDTAR